MNKEMMMIKFEMSKMREFSVEELCDKKYFGGLERDDFDGNGVLVIEDVSNEEGDDSGVLVYSYKDVYVLMSFDFGGSLCECDVYSSLDEVKEVL